MYRVLVVLLLLSSLVFSQTPPQKPAPARPAPPTLAQPTVGPQAPAKSGAASELPPSAPVITIEGSCEKAAAAANPSECRTVITREQFEKLVDAFNPDMPAGTRRQLANSYAQALVLSQVARQRGIEDRPEAQPIMQFARMNGLAQALLHELQQEAKKVPQAEVEKYYKEHAARFEEGTFERLYLPKVSPGDGNTPVDEAKLKAEADKLRSAAAAGKDFASLQKQAWDELGIKSTPPPTASGAVRRESVPPAQAKIFDLQPGQVSEPIEESAGIYIYKVVSKKTIPVEQARPEIDRALEGERFQREMENITHNMKPVFNEQYFGGGPPGAMRGAPPAGPSGAKAPIPAPLTKPPQPK
jgi:parvulin-like peptidyl-prolyl isomerase